MDYTALSRVVTVYKQGTSFSAIPSASDHDRAKRGKCEGWTDSSTRTNRKFLQSVDPDTLHVDPETGELLMGFAFTGTVGVCPDTAQDWHKLRRAFLMRLTRMGLIRSHWLTEWQARGVPHLHGSIYLPFPDDTHEMEEKIKAIWADVAKPYLAHSRGQHCRAIYDPIGWGKYQSKHAARGCKHYQRNSANIPKGWQGKTGRMWGKTGTWPENEPDAQLLTEKQFTVFRRQMRKYRIALAKQEKCKAKMAKRLANARRCLKSNKRTASNVKPGNEWMEPRLALDLVNYVKTEFPRKVETTSAISNPRLEGSQMMPTAA